MEKQKTQCQVCKGYLFKEDDIVVCPICGAPHHRDCYGTVGHCGVEEFHGTENQYDLLLKKAEQVKPQEPTAKIRCPRCFRELKEDTPHCPYCGINLSASKDSSGNFSGDPIFNHIKVVMADAYGGIDKDSEIDGVKVGDIKKFVGPNPQYYIPRFAFLKNKKTSWNWPAFLFPFVWLFYRKMYKEGILALISFIAGFVAVCPFNNFVNSIAENLSANYTYNELTQTVMENFSLVSPDTLLLLILGFIINLVCRLIFGLKGNHIYRAHCLEKIKYINENSEDIETDLQKKGGCNTLLMLFAMLLNSYLSQLIASLFI